MDSPSQALELVLLDDFIISCFLPVDHMAGTSVAFSEVLFKVKKKGQCVSQAVDCTVADFAEQSFKEKAVRVALHTLGDALIGWEQWVKADNILCWVKGCQHGYTRKKEPKSSDFIAHIRYHVTGKTIVVTPFLRAKMAVFRYDFCESCEHFFFTGHRGGQKV